MGKSVINEHFVPEAGLTIADYLAAGHKTATHHLLRYAWAEAVLADLRPRSVLDVACGSGYGSHGIATLLPDSEVTGADYDPTAIAFAQAHYRAENLSFVQMDMTRWDETSGPDTFDCVVSFDTLEHIEHREIAMQNLVDHLDPDGTLLLSTPVRSKNVLNPGWEHHKLEYSRRSLYDFLRRYFEEVLAPDFKTLPHVEVFDEVNGDRVPQVYLLKMNPVVCRRPIVIEHGR